MKIYYPLFLLLLMFSCEMEDGLKTKTDLVSFTGDFLEKERSIVSLFNNELTLINLKDSTESSYLVKHSIDTELNYLLSSDGKDTLDSFYAFKKKKMWFLTRAISDTTYSIQAIKKDGEDLIGWSVSPKSNAVFQSNLLKKQMDRKGFPLESDDTDKFLLKADKDKIIDIFDSMLDTLKAEVRMLDSRTIRKRKKQLKLQQEQEEIQKQILNSKYIKEIYPLPANDFITVIMLTDGSYNLELIDRNGTPLYTNQLNGTEITINLKNIPSGIHALLIKDNSGNILELQKVPVER